MSKKVSEAIKERYSCRQYSDEKVSDELILELLELANQAPSAGNQQNREFVVIKDKKDRKWLAQMNNQKHLRNAPVVILVTTRLNEETIQEYLEGLKKWDMTVKGQNPDKVKITNKFKQEFAKMKLYWMISDVAVAVENLLLAATEKGLASCWIGIMDFEGVSKRFCLPKNIVPICLVTLGYEKFPPEKRKSRKDINKLVHWGKYQN